MTSTDGLAPTVPDLPTFQGELETVLTGYFGFPSTVIGLERTPMAHRSSYALESLHVELDGGHRLRLVWKDVGATGLLAEARGAKPGFLHDPLREIDIYREVPRLRATGTAEYIGSVVDESLSRYWLFLEHVPGPLLWQSEHSDAWRRAAAWLGRMHAQFGDDGARLEAAGRLLSHDRAFYGRWLERGRAVVASPHSRHGAAARDAMEWLASRYAPVLDVLLSLKPTLVHGEFYPSNIIVPDGASDGRVCPVDWEMAGWGPGLMDLAALVAGDWSAEDEAALLDGYVEAFVTEGGAMPTVADVPTVLSCCRLQVALQWLGWSETWVPPRGRDHDWLADAVRQAEALGL